MPEFLNKEITIQTLQEGLFQLEKLWGDQCMAGAIHPKMINRKRNSYKKILTVLKDMDNNTFNQLTSVEKNKKQIDYKKQLFE